MLSLCQTLVEKRRNAVTETFIIQFENGNLKSAKSLFFIYRQTQDFVTYGQGLLVE